jgi:hypothetical protein
LRDYGALFWEVSFVTGIATLPAIVGLMVFSSTIQEDSRPAPVPTLVSLHEMSVDFSPPGVTSNSCILIQTDGHFHIETRVKTLQETTASLHIYESSLDEFHLRMLTGLVDNQSVRDLKDFINPAFPMTLSRFSLATVQIPRDGSTQRLGYLVWERRAGMENHSPESTPDSVKEQWRTAQTALTPLVLRLHEMEGMNWPEVPKSRSSLCGFVWPDSPPD